MGKCLSISIGTVSDKIGHIEQELNAKYKPVAQTPGEPLPAVPIKIDDEEDLDIIFADSEI